MKTILDIIGWALIGLVALVGVMHLIASAPDPAVKKMQTMLGWILIVSAIAVSLLPVSNFFVLLGLPVALFLPTILIHGWMKANVAKALSEQSAEPKNQQEHGASASSRFDPRYPPNGAIIPGDVRASNSRKIESQLKQMNSEAAVQLAFAILQEEFYTAMENKPNFRQMMETGTKDSDYHPYNASTYVLAFDTLERVGEKNPKLYEYISTGRVLLLGEFSQEELGI